MKVKKIVYTNKPLVYLIFDQNPELRVLDVRKLECQYCLDNFDKLTIDEFGGLEWDAAHSLCPDKAYELTRQIHRDELMRLVNWLVTGKELTVRKLSRAVATALLKK